MSSVIDPDYWVGIDGQIINPDRLKVGGLYEYYSRLGDTPFSVCGRPLIQVTNLFELTKGDYEGYKDILILNYRVLAVPKWAFDLKVVPLPDIMQALGGVKVASLCRTLKPSDSIWQIDERWWIPVGVDMLPCYLADWFLLPAFNEYFTTK